MPISKLKATEARKQEAERLQGFLQEMLREEENKYCADCEQKAPRWASWNLGVFLCIRCAGLHRNLGVHISKVKSVTLDTWTPEQVQSMRVMGNAKARAVYECELPPLFRRPQTDQSLEQFIRAKYEAKRYIMKGWVPPSIDIADLPASPESTAREQKVSPSSVGHLASNKQLKHSEHTKINADQPSKVAHANVQQLIDFDLFAPAQPQMNKFADFEQKKLGSMDDLFGPIVSAAPCTQPPPPSSLLSSPGIPASVSSPNLSANTDDNLLSAIFGQEQSRTSTNVPPASNFQLDFAANFNAQLPKEGNASNLLEDSLIFDNLTLGSLTGNQSTAQRGAQSNSGGLLSSPPPSDTKKSTSEILSLFKR